MNASGGGPTPVEPSEPVWFGPADRPLFGWVHRPDGGDPRGIGSVVLCPPLFREQAVAHHPYRVLARGLSMLGFWVVRFDYEGTGDSAGPADGPGRVAAWLAGIAEAVAVAAARHRSPVVLVGMRMGAVLAALAAGACPEVGSLVLWDPCLSGRAFLRHHQALHRLRFGGGRSDGSLELPGALLDPATAADVFGLALPMALPVDRALVLRRPGRLAGVGFHGPIVTVEDLDAGEQEALLEMEPLHAAVPTRGIDRLVRWLAATAEDRPPTRSRPPSRRPATDRPAEVPVAVAAGPEHPGVSVLERAVRLGPNRLFAVETRPARTEPLPGAVPAVVFLSSGSDPHSGPSRLWTTLARRWAADGVRCVRVDLSGLGDSPARPGRPEQVLRAPEAFDDVADVVDAVVGDRRDAILVGLCSGAYQALESALELAPRGVLAVNPILRFTPPETAGGGPMSGRRRLCQFRSPWMEAWRSGLPAPLVEAAVAARIRWLARGTGRGAVGGWPGELAALGVDALCVCGPDEARQLMGAEATGIETAGVSGAAAAGGGLRVEVIDGLDHALLDADQRQLVANRLTEGVRRLGRREPAAAGRAERTRTCEVG